MNLRQLVLLCAAVFFVVAFFSIDHNRTWLNNRILNFHTNIAEELEHPDCESRKQFKWNAPYIFTEMISRYFDSIKETKPVLLTPTAHYLRAKGINFSIPEPIVCYYYSGLYTRDSLSKNKYDARWAIYISDGAPAIKRLANEKEVDLMMYYYNHPDLPL